MFDAKIRRRILDAALFSAAALAAGAVAAQQDGSAKVEVGVLTCDLTQSSNYVVLSKTEYLCTLDARGHEEKVQYIAKIGKVGIDLSSTEAETLSWGVVTSSDQFALDMMEGRYVGASADIAVGKGGGVRALVGGKADSVSLQPISVSTQDGIGVAAGLESMTLRRVEQQ